MKRYSLILCLVLILSLSGVASAQVLMPADAGGTVHVNLAAYGYTFASGYISYYLPATIPATAVVPLPPLVGYTSYFAPLQFYTTYLPNVNVMANLQAAFEFNLGTVPTTFTSKDFTAKLDGLSVDSSAFYYGSGTMNVDLFDMGDGTEDGIVYYNDYNSRQGSRIARLPHVFGGAGARADFDNIDVTCAVRNDLFGAGQTDFSGFILKSPDSRYELLWYDDTPTLTITPGVPGPKCASGGGGGGGCFIANAAR